MSKFRAVKFALASIFVSFALTGVSISAETPVLPASAVKLTGPEIKTLYQGNMASFNNFTNKVSLTGSSFYDFDKKRSWGFYVWDNKDRGLYKGVLSLKNDTSCYKSDQSKELCTSIYRDGSTIYEVDKKGVVTSVNIVQPASTPAAPTGIKMASPEDLQKTFGGKFVNVTIYDLGAPTIARVKWDWKKKRITGEYVYDGKDKGKVNSIISLNGDKVCAKGKSDKQPNCHSVVIKDNVFYEITDTGSVHAVSVLD